VKRSAPALLVAALLAGCGSVSAAGPVTQVLAVPSSSDGPSALAGGLVAGLPGVVPVPPTAHVTASALQPRGSLLGVSVTGTSAQDVADLLAFFRRRLTAAGFTATDDHLLPKGAAGAAFGRGDREVLIVAVVDRGGERSWSVGGTVAAGSTATPSRSRAVPGAPAPREHD
jgi:hypothetical protein